ncbi:MAG TPA: NUDIX hydrolase [Phycisphaerae bacterium]|nr:NUDIX hydrolase [Phycisphaerae bacterium]
MPAEHSLARGKFLELVNVNGWEYVRRIRGRTPIAIAALTPDNRILLISQYRAPLEAVCIEIPAGLVGDHSQQESWQEAAARELLEETGWSASSFELLCHGPTSAGLTSEQIMLVRARQLVKVGPAAGDGSEQITLHEIPLPDVHAWLDDRARRNFPIDPKVYAALYFLSRPAA